MSQLPQNDRLFFYCTILYERLESESTNDGGVVLWSGKIIAVCDILDIPRGSYQRVVAALRNTGCIEKVEQGKRGVTPTTFILHKPPTLETQEELNERTRHLTQRPNYDRLSQEVEALRLQMGGFDITETMVEVEKRFEAITARLDLIEQHSTDNKATMPNNEGEKIT